MTEHKKRTADRQITKDEVPGSEDEDEATAGGPFQRAPDAVLQKRRIVKARRTVTAASSSSGSAAGAGADEGAQRSNPFAGVSLVASKPDDKNTSSFGQLSASVSGNADSAGGGSDSVGEKKDDSTKQMLPEVSASGDATAKKTNKNESDGKASVFGAFSNFSGFGTSAGTNAGAGGFGKSAASSSFGSTFSSGFSFGTSKGFGEVKTATTSTGFGEGSATTKTPSESDSLETTKDASATKSVGATVAAAQLPTDYKLESGEEEEQVLCALRCKAYRFGETVTSNNTIDQQAVHPSVPPSESALVSKVSASSNHTSDPAAAVAAAESAARGTSAEANSTTGTSNHSWIEVGIGPLKLLQNEKAGTYRIVQRQESSKNGPGTKVVLNISLLAASLDLQKPSDKHVRVSGAAENMVKPYLFKLISPSNASTLEACLRQITGGDGDTDASPQARSEA